MHGTSLGTIFSRGVDFEYFKGDFTESIRHRYMVGLYVNYDIVYAPSARSRMSLNNSLNIDTNYSKFSSIVFPMESQHSTRLFFSSVLSVQYYISPQVRLSSFFSLSTNTELVEEFTNSDLYRLGFNFGMDYSIY